MTTEFIRLAEDAGFAHAAIVSVKDLTFVPEYRSFCEDNLCGNYNLLSTCPPACGSAAEMQEKANQYAHALVLQTVSACDPFDSKATKAEKLKHNHMAEALIESLKEKTGKEFLFLSAGPYKQSSCMSAYCLDAQKMADLAGMECWVDDGKVRLFSLVLY